MLIKHADLRYAEALVMDTLMIGSYDSSLIFVGYRSRMIVPLSSIAKFIFTIAAAACEINLEILQLFDGCESV